MSCVSASLSTDDVRENMTQLTDWIQDLLHRGINVQQVSYDIENNVARVWIDKDESDSNASTEE